jgi:hypothetical protein
MWSRIYDCCLRCGTTEKKHAGKGLCSGCRTYGYTSKQKKERREYRKKYYQLTKDRVNYNKKNLFWKYGIHAITVFKKYKYQCDICKSRENLQIHHKDKQGSNVLKKFRNNNIDNLQLLCIKCHTSLHNTHKWAKDYNCCLRCKKTDRKHAAHGYCTKCIYHYNKEVINL